MIGLKQFRYGPDNLAYILTRNNEAMVIDGGAAEKIVSYVKENRLEVRYVMNTHAHADHTSGNQKLITGLGAKFMSMDELRRGDALPLAGETVTVIPAPGHTNDSVCFYGNNFLVTGDTLFNGTVGNCFSGDLESFYHSVKRLLSCPDDTRVYAGHDYVTFAMAVAQKFEPENTAIHDFLTTYDADHVVSTLEWEKRVNPYLRFNEPSIIALLKEKGLSHDTEYRRWLSIMELD